MGQYSPTSVVMSSPLPHKECMRRLAKVTATWGRLWYLDPKTALLPDPLLSGYTGKWSIRVSSWAEPRHRGGPRPSQLEAELAPAPNGGTMLKGQISRRARGKAGDDSSTRLLKIIAGVIDATVDVPDGVSSP